MSTNHPSSRFYTVILIALTVLVGLQSAAMTSAGAAGPVIATVSSPVLAGSSFNIVGSGFSAGARVNFFVSTAAGSINQGPLKPAAFASTSLRVFVSALTPLGQGVVAVQVINTDQGFAASNIVDVLLEGAASAGIPSLTAINGVGLAVSSTNPRYAVDNVETVVPRGSKVTLQGTGFDTTHGVAVDVFCAAAGGKVGPFYINPGNPGLSPTSITLMLPATGPFALPVGPASFVISNKGSDGRYAKKSNAVSVPIGRRIQVISVMQKGNTLIVDGTGLSTLTVINFYQTQKSGAVNLGGLLSGGVRAIPITLVSDTELRFGVPARAVPGPAYVQAINPPFVPFESSGNDPGGAFILAGPTPAPIPTATVRPTPTPTPTPTPISGLHPTATPGRATPTAKATGLPTATPTPQPAEAYGALLTGGMDNTLTASGSHPTLASAETYDEAKGVFTSTGPMGYPRTGHSVTVLSNGTILVAGGHNAFSMRAMPSAELYDIKTRSFSFTGGMNSARLAHAAVLLKNGQVLIAGGQNVDFSAMDLAEIYDPATGLFSPTASMRNPRVAPAAAMLNDGSVLIAGGADNNGLLASAELYDSGGAASVPVGSLTTVRQGATATLLPNGSVLIAGGASQTTTCTGCATATAEIFNPLTRTFTRTGNMHAARRGHSATPLPGGTVLIAGGLDDAGGAAATSAEIYNPATGAFTVTGTMNVARFEHVAGALASGKVLIAGGFNGPNTITNTAEIYDPATGKFAPVPGMTDSRADQGMGCFSLGGSASWDRRGAAHPAGKSN